MKRVAILMILQCLIAAAMQAQVIGGHVYGGGNQGYVAGKTSVHVVAGDIDRVFGGARMGNVGGRSYVHIDGANEVSDSSIIINQVYGGNDIAGSIGKSADALPTDLTAAADNGVTTDWNTLVKVSSTETISEEGDEGLKTSKDAVYIGALFTGGNGSYTYSTPDDGDARHRIYDADGTLIASNSTGFSLPELDKTYLEITGGSMVYAFGGGNNATVRQKAVIHVLNKSDVVSKILYKGYDKLTDARIDKMGINQAFTYPHADAFQIGNLFGGNNFATMAIRPTWNLQAGKIRNLYSGGNRGAMTAPEGLLLDINPLEANAPYLKIDYVYGGCRMADVMPTVDGAYVPTMNLTRANYPNAGLTRDYNFPDELSARVLVRGGDINNVYGGNDVTGKVYGGSAVGIYSSVRGNVYGGGNGAYAYTDLLQDDKTFGDFFFERQGELSTVQSLNAFRPNAEQVSIRLAGTAEKPTIIRGSVFCGGNCASLATQKANPLVELKIGSHVIADNLYLGNNGEKMIAPDILERYANTSFSTLNLRDPSVFQEYMEGVTMNLLPNLVFDNTNIGDPADYQPWSSYVGSFFCGGNVGSMAVPGKNTYRVTGQLNIYNKFVGGCNNADVAAGTYNAAYEGGVLGSPDEREAYTDGEGNIKDRLEITLENLNIVPLRWNGENTALVWNTNKWDDGEYVPVDPSSSDPDIRLLNGNVYGGCYSSGHVNGNVTININEDLVKKDNIFGEGKSGVALKDQRDDLMSAAMTVFGAGFGENTEIWGSTTVNLNNGYVMQVFGGGEKGVVGKKTDVLDGSGNVVESVYKYDPAYSTTVNLSGIATATSNDGDVEDLAEAEYIYGGGSEGDVSGNTLVNLGNGRVYGVFGGASDADILGHTEVYIGRQPDGTGGYKDGIPWSKEIIFGGNDFGGTIYGNYEDGYNFEARVRDYETDKTQLHGYREGTIPDVLKSSSYVEYLIGRVDTIFGGGYGSYDYRDVALYGAGAAMPKQHSAFVNIRPKSHARNTITSIYGGGTGYPGNRDDDKAQDRSYILIDIPDDMEGFSGMEVFGSGSYNGLGMGQDKDELASGATKLDEASAIIDLLRGRIHNVYGGSYNEGVTRRTVVNVPAESSIQVDNIFGGAYGTQILPPCDVYETQVNYKNTSEKAQVSGAIYGGNNNERRSVFTQVNISSPVYSNKAKGYTGTVYGAGRGIDTWSEYTEVNLLPGARVYNVYGGGEMGHVLNAASLEAYQKLYQGGPSPQIGEQDPYWKEHKDELGTASILELWKQDWKDAWTLGDYYIPNDDWSNYATNSATNLDHVGNRAELDDKTAAQLDGAKKHNTNVIINEGAVVEGYAYGGGLGNSAEPLSGDVYGTTYIAVLGGEVKKDVYAGGHAGALDNLFGANDFSAPGNAFVASANAYIQGGTVRNVYGGGYEGHVGHHVGNITATYSGDRLADSYVVIGKESGTTFANGVPAITRNVYGGGEGGSIYGTSHVTVNNGYIGYRYKNTGTAESPTYEYVEELDDKKPNDLDLSGNVFGGGYVLNSYVDETDIKMYGGTVRGSLYGGGEVGPIGRGTMKKGVTTSGALANGDATIVKAGKTQVSMYNGHVLRNVFGGGRGKDSWGGDGTMYMDPAVVATLDTKCKGYVFGQTDVRIHGGEIGTDEGMAYGYGNVFGGCDEGSVYSAYNQGGRLYVGKQSGKRYDDGEEGYYYRYNGTDYVNEAGTALGGAEKFLTEDCHVLVEPWLQVNTAGTYGGQRYAVGDYVPTSYLNTLGKKPKGSDSWPGEWDYFDAGDGVNERGVIIHNAVFGGGNISVGGEIYANTKTVFGNVSATIHDVYNRDLVTIGTGHTGGLYGDGNLTLVDGYRELNISNYGTDYYNIQEEIAFDKYKSLPPREQAYYELKYKCLQTCTDNEGTTYAPGSTLPQDELLVLFEGNTTVLRADGTPKTEYWTENGVVSRYAGRILNTIQRADFCGVFGSRMVMKGAKDRVPEIEDNTNYTVNRVREVSLNKKQYGGTDDLGEFSEHGNYFGIYSVVNYLGALTSDVDFHQAVRTTNNTDATKYKCDANGKTYGTATYADWKKQFHKDPRRNNGLSHNQVALASGVYLELTTEKSTGKTLNTKDWGLITGVVELDLINVAKGVGGGFVYAKNVHGVREATGKTHTLLTELNKTGGAGATPAVTNKSWKYVETGSVSDATQKEWQTSGNFVHNTQVIIDDCYNISNRYLMSDAGRVPAHYWYIRGSVYVYDQYITAHTGSANAYSKVVEIPITITAAMNNRMHLMDVQPNRYAYYSKPDTPLGDEQKLRINDIEYMLNDPISYWDWSNLPAAERKLFVEQTYVTSGKSKIGETIYPEGYVMLPTEYETLRDASENHDVTPDDNIDNPVPAVIKVITDDEGNDVVATDHEGHPIYVAFDDVFHSSNNMSHGEGYMLTYKMTNPGVWDTWYTPQTGSSSANKKLTKDTNFEDGPTFRLKDGISATVLGQREYAVGSIIPQETYSAHANLPGSALPSDQATFVPAYVVTKEYTSTTQHLYPGASTPTAIDGYTTAAYVCTSTIQLSPTEYIYAGDLLTATDINTYKTTYSSLASEIEQLVERAYYCTVPGAYGGTYYESGHNYRGLAAWSAMSESDRKNFTFNYDALDLLIDPAYGKTVNGQQKEGTKYQYDSEAATLAAAQANKATYSLPTPIDYTATYDGESSLTLSSEVHVKHSDGTEENVSKVVTGDVLESDAFETLLNEQAHYAPIDITAENKGQDIYITNTAFYYGEPFAAGQVIDKDTYDVLPDTEKTNVDKLSFATEGTYYYCRESYTIPAGGTAVTATNDSQYSVGSTVPMKTVISASQYAQLKNQQKNFTISGVSPMETSTLYVAREADINDLSTEKIITVIYQYNYEESDESGSHITPISERHVVNIHIKFESGVPVVDDIREPDIVLPGTSITMRVPTVTPGSYEIIGGGWQLFETKTDAESHTNGKEYLPAADPLYWYQDDFYLAYYARTYLGKTYSNYVPVHVANYHDLKRVMDDKVNHLHVDYDRTRLKRDSKIYINDYSASSENGLKLFKDFYDLSVLDGSTVTKDPETGLMTSGAFIGHKPLNNSTLTGVNIHDGQTYSTGVLGGTNLEFFLRTDLSVPSGSPAWTPIASGDDPCFNGTLHGDGHTISGLDNSLFEKLCGNVYNLGVQGSFNTAGIADTGDGYVESCWVKTTGTTPLDLEPKPYAVFGNPSDNKGYQVVNSYFCADNAGLFTTDIADGITTSGGARGKARAMSARAFYNGEVAYDLNNFYLYKRYSDAAALSGSLVEYKYWAPDNSTPQVGRYPDNVAFCSSGYNGIKYVEERFADGDFRYAAGEIPTTEDERYHEEITDETVNSGFYPIWPDDYIFFGQKLTYGWAAQAHQEVPTAVARDGGRLSQNADANRVYRAPAYYRSKEMGFAHFNPHAYLAQKELLTAQQIEDGKIPRDAYPGMTAIDFAGHNDTTRGLGFVADSIHASSPAFYPPLLDDDGLLSITNCDETQNLLAYAPAASSTSGYANAATHTVLTSYFTEPEYADYYDNSVGYRLVTEAPTTSVRGHLVQHDYSVVNDHLLVDKQDFNAPLAFKFDDNHRMWYQRTPSNQEYVEHTAGWQGISLPFTAELVTTNEKGEITHFYSGSETSKNGTGTKIGHEYWLREFNDIKKEEGDPTVARADFRYPTVGGYTKNVSNTFLWDYYYKNDGGHSQLDKNADTYLQYRQYYNTTRTYNAYPLVTAATPYILGLPGQTYYEFDLSGKFEALTTASPNPSKLGKQVITFASNTAEPIGISDDETTGKKVTYNDKLYNFKPSYMNESLRGSTVTAYTLDAAGDSFDKVADDVSVSAFRPYFLAEASGGTVRRQLPASIIFGGVNGEEFEQGPESAFDGSIEIYTRDHQIITTSHMTVPTTIRIVNISGVTINSYVLQPGQTIETSVQAHGTYIVNKKKVFIR